MNRDIFEDLFVLEMTNNHLGKLERGLKIAEQHARIVRFNNMVAAIKLQFRDVDSFIHKDYRDRSDIYYIRRVTETKMSKADYGTLVNAIRKYGCMPMATPFDEKSVDWCVEFDLPIIKVASADSNDWLLLERIAKTKKPVIVSVGGLSLKDMDDMVTFFENRNIPMAINHCVAAYPHEDSECELSQIDFLKSRYPNHTIGYSCHEYRDWHSSMLIAYAKGARTFERHIDIEDGGAPVAKYSSLPAQIDTWFKSFYKAKEMIGYSDAHRKVPMEKETKYLDSYVRGVYANVDLKEGQQLLAEDVYMAIPLRKGQISSRELMLGRYGYHMLKACKKDEPVTIDMVDTPYANNPQLKESIANRGI
ncbi:MAG TPA: N-acetylneuraminate synthase family protein [Verrucomicrobiae bacterium]|jgi:N-acetylneuraminate synthase